MGKYGEIPTEIIQGKVRKFRSVHTIYVSHFYQKMMEKINKSFWDRSKEGNTDELGNWWKPLHPNTHRYKPPTPQESGIYKLNNRFNRGLLSPGQRAKWNRIYKKEYTRLTTGLRGQHHAAKRKAEAAAWASIGTRGYTRRGDEGQRITPINIRTGRLVASTRPGTIANNQYYPPHDQSIHLRVNGLKLKLDVPYAKEVDKVRKIIPDNIQKWKQEAHNYAMRFALREYRRIKNVSKGIRGSRKIKTDRR